MEIPKDPANGDYTTTFALAAAKAMKMRPRDIAEVLLENIDLEGSYFASAEIAGAGFLNFRLGSGWYAGVMSAVESEGAAYGRSDIGGELPGGGRRLIGLLGQRKDLVLGVLDHVDHLLFFLFRKCFPQTGGGHSK